MLTLISTTSLPDGLIYLSPWTNFEFLESLLYLMAPSQRVLMSVTSGTRLIRGGMLGKFNSQSLSFLTCKMGVIFCKLQRYSEIYYELG